MFQRFNSLKERTVNIPVTEEMFRYLFSKQNIEGINKLSVSFEEEGIAFDGEVIKLMLPISFHILLVPFLATGRKLSFELKRIKPVNNNWINNKIFNGRTGITFENNILTIDLNQFEKIRKVPFGTIRNFQYTNKVIWCQIGI
ncbi:hypothetical protein AM500_05270 [Bacillus sp. FJAT-18017]|uniref:hypothetical protein n=1 Tax=Bacillus sp. FJAT-18017 TaxID=1705566 RepID=UPI0006AE0A70|nr:hypothetical protein [Bacillus sp. FJAT-18017]ALC89260.1 hypothetical protein AM500_05270 [Bacillus sp. FJAT-18017]